MNLDAMYSGCQIIRELVLLPGLSLQEGETSLRHNGGHIRVCWPRMGLANFCLSLIHPALHREEEFIHPLPTWGLFLKIRIYLLWRGHCDNSE
jgi:hypothetical protein